MAGNFKSHRAGGAGLPSPDDGEKHFRAALKTASNILGYAECPPAKLRKKLALRGYEEALITDVLDRLRASGLLDEDAMARRRAEVLFRQKGYGPRRLPPALRQAGFSSEAIAGVEFDPEDFPFTARCEALARKYGVEDRRKTAAYLARYGYTAAQIKHALCAASADEED